MHKQLQAAERASGGCVLINCPRQAQKYHTILKNSQALIYCKYQIKPFGKLFKYFLHTLWCNVTLFNEEDTEKGEISILFLDGWGY